MSRGIGAGIAAIAVAILAAAPAQGAITVGSDLQRAPTASACSGLSAMPCTLAIAGLAPSDDAAGGALVPQPGVIVRWRVRRDATMVSPAVETQLRVIRANTGAGRSAAETLPGTTGTHEFPTRLPVQAGDQIGIDLPGVTIIETLAIVRGSAPAADLLDTWDPPLAEAATTPPTQNDVTTQELLLNADLEPDADGDGFGDETQDLCPTNAATQLACAAGAPETTITKAPKKKSKKTKATVEFTANPVGSVFECSLDFVAYKSCTSPLKLKRLKKGKHTLLVRAVAFGIPDASPASAKFTVKKKKKRK